MTLNIPRFKEPIDIRHSWICSELIAEAYYQVGFRFLDKVDPDCITPADIVKSSKVKEIYCAGLSK